MASSSSSSKKRPSDAQWLQHKSVIRRMFIDEKRSILETRQLLEREGFTITKAQLEYKLKLWGFRRRVPKEKSDAVWKFIGHRVQRRRQQQGKETEVMIDKRIIDAATIRKEMGRHQDSTLVNMPRFQQNALVKVSSSAPSPRTPEGLDISLRTPAPLSIWSPWPFSLPWYQFQHNFASVFPAPSLLRSVDNISVELDHHKEDPALTRMLRFLVPYHPTGSSITQVAAEIGSIMPESYENENSGRATRLLQGTAEERYTEYVKVTLYKLSNNIFSDDVGGRNWENITDLLEISGIMKTPIRLERITDITMSAVAEKLFQWAMRFIAASLSKDAVEKSVESRIIDWLLKSGQNPNIRIQYVVAPSGRTRVSTPLQMAADAGSLYLMSQFLDHGACPNLTFVPWDGDPNDDQGPWKPGYSMHPLLTTVQKYPEYPSFDDGRLLIVKRLMELGSNVSTESVIRMMVRTKYWCPKLLETLTHWGAGIFDEVKAARHLTWFVGKFIVIDCTANFRCETQELHPFFRLLKDYGILNRSQIPKTVDTTSIVLLAAAANNSELLEDLHNYGIDTTATGSLGCSALHVAAHHGHLETCKKLVLEHLAPVNGFESSQQTPSPLHFAAAAGHLSIVRFLHQNKADVNREFDDEEGDWHWFFNRTYPTFVEFSTLSPVVSALVSRNDEVAQYLFESGAKAPSWAVCDIRGRFSCRIREKLVNLALEAGADPLWDIETRRTSIIRPDRQFIEALRVGDTIRAQQLVLDAQEHDLWNDATLSILEAAIISRHGPTVEKTFSRNPGAYDPGALCAKILFSASSTDSLTIHRLLSNRPRSEETSDLEALAIGLAAWSGQLEVFKLLLAEFHQPVLAKAPRNLRGGLSSFSAISFSKDGKPFWHWDSGCMSVSPIVFALTSREALHLMLNHGYIPDRLTMRAAINDFDPDTFRTLVQSPRLSGCPDCIQGPLSYAARYRKYDIVRFLLENGEDVNEDNFYVTADRVESNRNPLQSAVENNDMYLIDLLLKSGVDVNAPAARDGGATALQVAALWGRLGVLRTLIDHGADINAPGAEYFGRTALEGAAEYGRIDVIQYLLSQEIRTTDGDRLQYLRAVRYAQIEGHQVAANLLRGHREWTKDDRILWAALEGLGRTQLQRFKGKTQEVPSSLTLLGGHTTPKDSEVGSESTKDGPDRMGSEEDVYDPSEGMEPPDDLEDMEMRTNDPMAFVMGEM